MSTITGRNSVILYNGEAIDLLSGETKFKFVVFKNKARSYCIRFYIGPADQERLQWLARRIVSEMKENER